MDKAKTKQGRKMKLFPQMKSFELSLSLTFVSAMLLLTASAGAENSLKKYSSSADTTKSDSARKSDSASASNKAIDCNSTSQRVLNSCAKNEYERADFELNEIYKNVVEKLQTEETKNRLKDAQRAWLLFRDKDCRFRSGGHELTSHSISTMTYYFCLGDRTKTRIKELKEFANCTQSGCPH